MSKPKHDPDPTEIPEVFEHVEAGQIHVESLDDEAMLSVVERYNARWRAAHEQYVDKERPSSSGSDTET